MLLAGPIIATMVSRTAMGIVDFVMVSQLGTEAQAAIVPAGITLFTVIAFGMGVMTAVNTLVAQHAGRDEPHQCASYTWQGLWLSAVLGVGSLVLWPAVPWLFEVSGHEPSVAALEVVYVQIGLLGIGPILAAMAVANFFNGIHRPMIGLWATLISNAFNVVANYALIFGGFGFPAMGVEGAAWATTLASVVNLLALVLWWVRPAMHRTYDVWRQWRFHAKRMRRTLRLGLPAGFHFAADIATFAAFTLWLIGRFGTTELAAHNIALKFFEVAIIPCAGMGVAVASAVGRSIGQKRLDRARRFAHWGNGMGLLYLIALSGVYLVVDKALIGLLTDDGAVATRAWHLLCVAMLFQCFDCTQMIYANALRGAGDTLWPAIVTPIAALSLMLGGGYGLAVWWPAGGAIGPWLALTVYVLVLSVCFVLRFTHGPWETMDATGAARPGAAADDAGASPPPHMDPESQRTCSAT